MINFPPPMTEPKPNKEKVCENGENESMRFASCAMKGWPFRQEDAHNCILDYNNGPEVSFFAVYDGYKGANVSKYLAQHFFKERIVVANIGDSRAVLCRSGQALDLSSDHKATVEAEKKRIEAAGGEVDEKGRLNGGKGIQIQVSRAFGHHFLKQKQELPPAEQMLTAVRCQISTESKQLVSAEHLAYLTLLEPAKPVFVHVETENSVEASLSTLLRHPTILNCSRLKLAERVWAQDTRQPILDWLHHNPMAIGLGMGEKDSSSASCIDVVDQQQKQPDIRALWLYCGCFHTPTHPQAIVWMLERCVQHLQQSREPSDRRHFLLAFRCREHLHELNRFARTENASTGEVLLLESFVDVYGHVFYRLMRCLASQIAKDGTKELYAKLFKSHEKFNIGDVHGKEPLKVIIEEEKPMDGPGSDYETLWGLTCHCGFDWDGE